MSKAIIATGGKQYIVSEGETLNVELLDTDKKQVTFEPLLVIDGDNVSVGAPVVSGVTVMADILDEVKADKVTSIRYKAKKRVHKLRGHRQRLTPVTITKIG
ncbi:MAG TPA: 50S ribosomal protein L21 [Candidatus Limnocylindrales bacterium]|nr:50S ribosomal protein L21 [Candidatus Limnocylindrales bacterium]